LFYGWGYVHAVEEHACACSNVEVVSVVAYLCFGM